MLVGLLLLANVWLLPSLEARFSAATVAAFRCYALKGWSVERVCRALNLTPNQVYLAKSRVTRRLCREMRRLVGDVD